MRKPGRGQILENRLVGPREVLGGGDRRVPAKGRGRTAPCRGRSGASWIWATPLTPARARGSSVRATPSLRPPRILKTSLFLQKGGPRKEPSQRTATALFYLIPCGDFQLSPREFYLSLIRPDYLAFVEGGNHDPDSLTGIQWHAHRSLTILTGTVWGPLPCGDLIGPRRVLLVLSAMSCRLL